MMARPLGPITGWSIQQPLPATVFAITPTLGLSEVLLPQAVKRPVTFKPNYYLNWNIEDIRKVLTAAEPLRRWDDSEVSRVLSPATQHLQSPYQGYIRTYESVLFPALRNTIAFAESADSQLRRVMTGFTRQQNRFGIIDVPEAVLTLLQNPTMRNPQINPLQNEDIRRQVQQEAAQIAKEVASLLSTSTSTPVLPQTTLAPNTSGPLKLLSVAQGVGGYFFF